LELSDWAAANDTRLPIVPPDCEHPAHIYYLLLPHLEIRQALIAHLKERGILAVFHYLPLHLSVMGRKYGGKEGDCPVTERVSDQLLRLPLFYALSADEQTRVVDAIYEFQV
jgi:dTDP-4-amino-4,6-dideoxygalactose transaminase